MFKSQFFLLAFFGFSAWLHAFSCPPGVTDITPPDSANDPFNARFYRLANGLTIALSVNTEKPRVQTLVGVRAGSLQDPADKTGLAHYLEHLLFKGSKQLGTRDFNAESPILEQIDMLYDQRCATVDTAVRDSIYAQIDALSVQAANFAIPNEFVNAVQLMGADGTNAYTSYDRTVYINDIPANQLSRWILLEKDRFGDPVFRGFHTELETVYEEFNMSQDNIQRRFWYFVYENLYGVNPRGRPVIGLGEHLKNPSPRSVMRFYRTWYVPNNMIVALAGDFDPEKTLRELNTAFGCFQPGVLPETPSIIPPALRGELRREITVPDHQMVLFAWRVDSLTQHDEDLLDLCAAVLSNGAAGLLDQNLNIPQKVTSSFAGANADRELFGTLLVGAIPKSGETPESVEPLILAQIAKLKNGDVPDWLPEAIVRQSKLARIKALDSNEYRASRMIDAFLDSIPWQDIAHENERLSAVTKAEIQSFACKHFNENRLCFIRRSGAMTAGEKLPKPKLTPLPAAPDVRSAFVEKLFAVPAEEIQPQFPDLQKEITARAVTLNDTACVLDSKTFTAFRRLNLASVQNVKNDFFSLRILYRNGSLNDPLLPYAAAYANTAGVLSRSMEDIQLDLYRLAGSVSVSSGNEETVLSLSGLNENFDELLNLAVSVLDSPRLNKTALDAIVEKTLLSRKVAREDPKNVMMKGLFNYARYGLDNPVTRIPSAAELQSMTPEMLCSKLRGLNAYPARILYYGPMADTEVSVKLLGEVGGSAKHTTTLFPLPEARAHRANDFAEQPIDSPRVIFVNMPNFRQVQMLFTARGGAYRKDDVGTRMLFNEYFGVGMGSITFQRLREANSLCYSCQSWYATPSDVRGSFWYHTYLTTQADKISDAIAAVKAIGFPLSFSQIETAKTTLLRNQAAERWTGESLLNLLESSRKMNLPPDYRQYTYERISETSPADLLNFYQAELAGNPMLLLVIGDKSLFDLSALEACGPVTEMTLDQILPLP